MTALPTAALADAAVRIGVAAPALPPALRMVVPGGPLLGPVRPVTHLGSVDVLLETIDAAAPGDVIVVDNGGRLDEACIGDLMALEAAAAGIAAMVVWGLVRDLAQLREIGLPVWALGTSPYGPRRVPPGGPRMAAASVDGVLLTGGETIAADADGVLVLPTARLPEITELAARIVATETAQATAMRAGTSLRGQLDFGGYRAAQRDDARLTLRAWLARRGGAVET